MLLQGKIIAEVVSTVEFIKVKNLFTVRGMIVLLETGALNEQT